MANANIADFTFEFYARDEWDTAGGLGGGGPPGSDLVRVTYRRGTPQCDDRTISLSELGHEDEGWCSVGDIWIEGEFLREVLDRDPGLHKKMRAEALASIPVNAIWEDVERWCAFEWLDSDGSWQAGTAEELEAEALKRNVLLTNANDYVEAREEEENQNQN